MVAAVADGLAALGVARRDRVAIFLPKSVETVAAIFGTSAAGGVFVPINPVLKPPQVEHILRDSGAKVLITAKSRLAGLVPLPSKWTMVFGAPVDVAARFAADRPLDPATVDQVAGEIRATIQSMLDERLRARRSAFF